MEDKRFEQLEESQRQQDIRLQQHGEAIAVLKNIAEKIDSHIESMTESYKEMQGALTAYITIKADLEKVKDDVHKIDLFLSNLKGKMAVWVFVGSLIGGGVITIILEKLK